MIRVTDTASARMKRLASTSPAEAIGKALHVGAETIAETAKRSILDGAVSGAKHVPSAPGQPPNADTHHLDESIYAGEVIETPGRVQTSVIVDAEYGRHLEFGTSHMEARPFLRPATELNRQSVIHAVAAAVRRHENGR